LFDFATFGVLYFVYHASPGEFRTAWFIESLLTEILILLVIRTRRSFFKSKPSRALLVVTFVTFVLSIALPYLPFADMFQFISLPFPLLSLILLITFSYIFVAEEVKKYLFTRI
jgi:Mg2+-importing ATPase